jgi:hypothetical protein
MRNDMFKVIVERPRRGVGYFRTLPNDYRAAKRFKLDDDFNVDDEFCGRKLPMRARQLGWDGKELNENLNPLKRYLAKQVGRLWNDVYSEICEQLDTGSTVKQHVRQHLTDFVTVKTYIDEDGDLIALTRWGPRVGAYNDLWVDADGILRGHTEPKTSYNKTWRKRRAKAEWEYKRVIDGVEYEKDDKGLWFRVVKTERLVMKTYYAGIGKPSIKRLETVVTFRKWSLNKKELRGLKFYESID